MEQRILIVEDEDWVVRIVKGYLREEGFRIQVASDGQQALDAFRAFQPHLIILDLMLPAMDGLEVARRVRKSSEVPIIMLTARGDEADRVAGLEIGADDYVVKPFSPRELVSRVRAVLRRAEGNGYRPTILESGGVRLDLDQRHVTVQGTAVELTPMEFELLALLMESPGRVFTRLQILEAVRGVAYESFERSVDTHVKRLRQKIEPDAESPSYVLTVYGVGYKFNPEITAGEMAS